MRRDFIARRENTSDAVVSFVVLGAVLIFVAWLIFAPQKPHIPTVYRCNNGIEEVKKANDEYWKSNIVDGQIVKCSN